MKIFVISNDFKPSVGGIAEYTYSLLNTLARNFSHEITIYAPEKEGASEFDSLQKIKIIRRVVRKKNILKTIIDLYALIKSHECTIIGNFVTDTNEAIAALILCKVLRKTYVPFAYGKELVVKRSIANKMKLNAVFRCANHILAITEFTKSLVVSLKINSSNISVAYPAIEIPDFINHIHIQPKQSTKKIMLSLSRLEERKGFDMVLKALPHVIKEFNNFTYVIAGTGRYEDNLKKIAKSLNIQSYVDFYGQVSDNKKWDLYQQCDFFAMPCRMLKTGDVEGFGIVYLEAAALSKPSIAGNSGGAPEVVLHMETGIVVNPEDEYVIADAILQMFNNQNLTEKLGQNAFTNMKKFNWERSSMILNNALTNVRKK